MSSPLQTSLGLQSYCFRDFKNNADVARQLLECGVQTVELCAVHADFQKPELFDSYIKPYKSAGIQITSIGVESADIDEKKMENLGEFTKASGAKHISVHFQPETSPASWRLAEKLAEKYGIRIAIHNHGGYHWLGSSQMLTHVLKNTSERIGLTIDTAWALQTSENPVSWIEKFTGRIYGLHIKDFTFLPNGKWKDVIVGTGNLDLPAFIAGCLKETNLGYAVVEYEADAANPVPPLTECVKAVRACLK